MLKLLFSLVLGFAVAYIYEFGGRYILKMLFQNDRLGLIIYGYRLHHSLYGILFLFLSLINRSLFFAGFGVGIIVQHTLFGGFQFVSREI